MTELFRPLPPSLRERAAAIRLLALDVDGVLSDGRLYFSAEGDELKSFSTLDGHGIKLLMGQSIEVAIITGRTSPLVARRARDLGVRHLLQGREDKLVALRELTLQLGLDLQAAAYMGDDLPDLPAIRAAGLGLTVPNAHWLVRQHAHWCTQAPGGHGAVREACDLILDAKDLLAGVHAAYLQDASI